MKIFGMGGLELVIILVVILLIFGPKNLPKLGNAIGYQYPHEFPNHYVRQQYLPDNIADRVYYEFGDNKQEQAAAAYRKMIKGE